MTENVFSTIRNGEFMTDKDYKSRGEDFFFDYLPEEVFSSLSKEERVHYREYRRYHRLLYENQERIDFYEREIEKLKSLLKEEKKKLRGNQYKDGWELKMKNHYEHISHLHEKFLLKTSIELRDRSSKSQKIKSGEEKRKTLETVKKTYGGEEIQRLIMWYGTVAGVQRNYRKTMYLGKRDEINQKWEEFIGEDISEKSENYVKGELQLLMSQYTRYKVFNSDWNNFTSGTHNLESIMEWVIYCRDHGIDRSRWGTWGDM